MTHNPEARNGSGEIAVVGYARISTPGQIDNFSIPTQIEAIRNYCKQHKFRLLKIYEDLAVSGSLQDRPALNDLLRHAKERAFSKLIVYRIDRLSRDLYTQLWLTKELLVCDIEVMSISEPYNGQDPMSTAMRQIVGVFAQLEKGRITERLLDGRKQKLSKGGYAGGRPAYAYTVKNGVLVVNEKEAEIVRRIYRLRYSRKSLQDIADILNTEKIPSRYGREWHNRTVLYILRNPIYRGFIRYGEKSKGTHSPIPV
jgi:site-specific DNA recombinase